MLKRRYSLFIGPSTPNTTQEATVSVPPVWLMSKHSMRLGASSRSKASRNILEARLDAAARERAHLERLLGVVVHHLEPARADAADRAR